MAQHSLKDVLPGVLQKIGVTDNNFALMSLLESELAFLGPKVQVSGIRDHKIYVELESSVHLQEAGLRKNEILKTLKSAMPRGEAREALDIKFYLKGTNYRLPKFVRPGATPGAPPQWPAPAPARKVRFSRYLKSRT